MENKNILLEGVTHQPRHAHQMYTQGLVTHTFGGNVVETPHDIPVPDVPAPTHDYVEIAGIKWATMNVGATSETDTGLYFLWGDTQGYTFSLAGKGSDRKAFEWTDYKFNPSCDGKTFTKYNSTDGKTKLDLEDDAVAANWGGAWRMPTIEELQTLVKATRAEQTFNYNDSGRGGILLTSKNDSAKKLFFPFTTLINSNYFNYISYKQGFFWSSSINNNDISHGNSADINTLSLETYGHHPRCQGCTVRGVLDD